MNPSPTLPATPSRGRGCRWTRLVWLLAVGLSGAFAPLGAQAVFEDRSEASGLDFEHFNGMTGELYFAEMMGSGAALVDYDRDGDLDVYLVQGSFLAPAEQATVFKPRHSGSLVDRLYRNDLSLDDEGRPVVRFVDVTETKGCDAAGYGMGVATGDYDNDGWVDLYITNLGVNQMCRNNGDGTFSDTTSVSRTGDRDWGVSAAFFDYDLDGWLDLYVGNYVDSSFANHKQCVSQTGAIDYCGPLAFQPQPDRLFRNRGDGTFEDASGRVGGLGPPHGALGVASGDFNADGHPDLYVANDQAPNKLLINQGDGTLVDEALLSGTAVNAQGQAEASMGVVVGDLDGDSVPDLFLSHLTRETNTFYRNQGGALFDDVTRDSGLGRPSWQATGFGVALLDYDLDGWLDLFIANGAVKRLEALARSGDRFPLHQANQLFRNLGGGQFTEVERAGQEEARSEVSRGAAAGDVDNDGDPDILISNCAGQARLLTNLQPDSRSWCGAEWISEAGTTSRSAEFERRVGDRILRSDTSTAGSYASAGDPRVVFGLDRETSCGSIRVRSPSGMALELRDLPAKRYLVLSSASLSGRKAGP